MEFKKGDTVLNTSIGSNPQATVLKIDKKEFTLHYSDDSIGKDYTYPIDNLKCFSLLKGGAMNKYQELERRIGGVQGWDKEADDILTEIMMGGANKAYRISAFIGDSGCLRISSGDKIVEEYGFFSQCEKLSAFKKALLWLLEHSNIKKEDNQLEIDQIKADMKSLQDRLDKIS